MSSSADWRLNPHPPAPSPQEGEGSAITPSPACGRGGWGVRAMREGQKLSVARRLRITDATDVERTLWRALRNRQFGTKFRRQQPIGPYVVDFVSHEARLVIELDGGQHNTADGLEYDAKRTAFLEREGFRVLRFWNNDVLENVEGVVSVIAAALTPGPSPAGGRGEKTDA